MKMQKVHMEKSGQNRASKRLLALSAAAVMIFAAAFFCVHFYNFASSHTPENPFADLSQSMTQYETEGEKYETDTTSRRQDSADSSQTDDDTNTDTNSDSKTETDTTSVSQNDNVSDNIGGNVDTPNGISNGGNSVNTQQKGDKKSEDSNVTNKKPNSKTETDTTKSDTEYFTTSIKDGEKVEKTDFAFTITHKSKSLTVKKVAVSVNGDELPQFTGKCTLKEGKNTIRVACTYTDKSGEVKRAYKDYTVYCDLGEITIETSLSDGDIDTDSDSLEFTAFAYVGKEKLSPAVSLNDEKLGDTADGRYSVTLSEGENIIKISAEKGEKKAEKTYRVTYTKAEFSIDTDLFDRTVSDENFGFYVKMKGQNGSAKLTVAFNGKNISGENGAYNVTLKTGANRIRVRAKDGEKLIEQTFTITFTPAATDETRPKLTYINISDNMTVKGTGFTLRLYAEDYQGGRIYADSTEVYLNGVWQSYLAQDSQSVYYLDLKGGANLLEIRIYDGEGRYADFAYIINCSLAADGEQIGTVKISFDANVIGLGQLAGESEIPIYQGENGSDAIERFLEQNGFTAHFTGPSNSRYLSRIYKDGAFAGGQIDRQLSGYLSADGIGENGVQNADSLGEMDYTNASGWVYTVNGEMTGYGMSQVNFSDGDVVRLAFTLAYGKDITGSQNSYDRVW